MKPLILILLLPLCLVLVSCNKEPEPEIHFEITESKQRLNFMISVSQDSIYVELPTIKDSSLAIANMAVMIRKLYLENDSLREKTNEYQHRYSVKNKFDL